MKTLELKVLNLEFLKKSEVKKLMADRFYGYQYDTTPRKLNSQYMYYRNRYPQEEEPVETTKNNRHNRNNSKRNTVQRNSKNVTRDEMNIQERRISEYERKQVINKNNKVQKNVQSSKNIGNYDNIQEDEFNNAQGNKITKASVKARLKIVMFLVAGFSVLFAISYQNSLISESFNRKEQYKKEMEALSKTNQQIEVSIENNLNLNNIEQTAKEQIGMQKLSNNQKIYVNLPKQDFVAPASEQVVIEENQNFFQKLFRSFGK